jgi:glycosyltransferase involved in cell wall biosynthesis
MSAERSDRAPRASVVVNNYNYAPFLREAIDSALAQTYAATEVVVVDDGSTDESPEIIEAYGERVIPVVKSNRGQASAMNAGLEASSGQVVCFLDADDVLLPSAVERAVESLADGGASKVHWPLREMDEDGSTDGQLRPGHELPEGDLLPQVLRDGPDAYITAPTSGNAFSRGFLQSVLPIPEDAFRVCADTYLAALAPLYGEVRRIPEPQGLYRVHGSNRYAAMPFHERLDRDLALYRNRCLALAEHCRSRGLRVDLSRWEAESWLHRLDRARNDIAAVVPPGETFLLADEDQWQMRDDGHRRAVPFPQRGGVWWGRPADDAEAVRELERAREQSSAAFLVFGWPAYWWLDYYEALSEHVRSRFRPVIENERVRIFEPRGQ